MKKWILKAIIQKSISFLPFKNQINFLFQKYVTKGVYLSDEYFEDRLMHAANHLKGFKKLTGNTIPTTTFELGTGWYPVVPFAFFLCGSINIHSIDISKLTNKERLLVTIRKYLDHLNNPEKMSFFNSLPIDKNRLIEFKNLAVNAIDLTENEILLKLNLKLSIADAQKTIFKKDFFDLVHSNNTFEHIYPEILKNILIEFSRITKKKGGVMSHFIDMSDHYAHFDKSITIYNFLNFSPEAWKWIDNSVQPLNRLRMTDYYKIYSELNIPVSLVENREGDVESLRTIKIAAIFKKYTMHDLAISHSHLYSYL